MPAALVLPAAGRGTRFGGTMPKQFLPLAGVPVIARSLAAFAGLVAEAVIAAPADLHDEVCAAIATRAPPFPVRLVVGGATRQDSVHAALLATSPDADAVLVHDAVRPLVPRTCILACLEALTRHDAAVVAVPCTATVKESGTEGLVARTVPRERLWLAQTPQGFRRNVGLAAFARAAAEGWTCSDDAQVLERAGHSVALVPGDARNLKITTADDLALAEALLAQG